MIYHVLNRANFRSHLFKTPAHHQDFLAIVEEAVELCPCAFWLTARTTGTFCSIPGLSQQIFSH
jgi:hypothetical protein